jgi:hypothetical protein
MVLMKQLRMYTIPCIGVDKATMLHPRCSDRNYNILRNSEPEL